MGPCGLRQLALALLALTSCILSATKAQVLSQWVHASYRDRTCARLSSPRERGTGSLSALQTAHTLRPSPSCAVRRALAGRAAAALLVLSLSWQVRAVRRVQPRDWKVSARAQADTQARRGTRQHSCLLECQPRCADRLCALPLPRRCDCLKNMTGADCRSVSYSASVAAASFKVSSS